MSKLILAALLLLSGTALFLLAARSFRSLKINAGLGLTALLFFAQATVLLGQIKLPESMRKPKPQASASAAPEAGSAGWDQGGTLQKASYEAWRMGTYADRLASAADLLKALRREQLFKASIRSEQDYQPWAAALVACLEAEGRGGVKGETPVPDLARKCVAGDLGRYR